MRFTTKTEYSAPGCSAKWLSLLSFAIEIIGEYLWGNYFSWGAGIWPKILLDIGLLMGYHTLISTTITKQLFCGTTPSRCFCIVNTLPRRYFIFSSESSRLIETDNLDFWWNFNTNNVNIWTNSSYELTQQLRARK